MFGQAYCTNRGLPVLTVKWCRHEPQLRSYEPLIHLKVQSSTNTEEHIRNYMEYNPNFMSGCLFATKPVYLTLTLEVYSKTD